MEQKKNGEKIHVVSVLKKNKNLTVHLAKLNTDGSHVPPTGEAGGGMILRDERGDIIYTACRQILTCDNGLEAELAACREGLELALYRTNLLIMVELDCAEAVSMLLHILEIDRSTECLLRRFGD